MCEHYHALLTRRTEIFRQLNLSGPGGRYDTMAHCPAVADRISDYLRNGQAANSVIDGGHEFRIPDTVRWRRMGINQIGRDIRDCHHAVVRATRSVQQQDDNNLSAFHFFVLFRLDGTLYVADPFFAPAPSADLEHYRRGLIYQHLDVASANYDVQVVDMFDPVGI